MISCYEGLPGSGKSYDAVKKLLVNLKTGRRVLTNIDGLQNEHQRTVIKHYTDFDDIALDNTLVHMDDEQTTEFWKHSEKGDLIVIDEAQNYFNSRDWQTVTNRELGKWAALHRHLGIDVVFITQNMAGIESSVRRLVEWVYRYKKINMFGGMVQKRYVRFAFFGESSEPLGKTICTYDQKIFACYSSYFAGGTDEIGMEKPFNVLKHPVFFLIPVFLVALIYFGSKSFLVGGGIFSHGDKLKDPVTIVETFEKQIVPGGPGSLQAEPGVQVPLIDKPVVMGIVNGKTIYKNKGGIFLL